MKLWIARYANELGLSNGPGRVIALAETADQAQWLMHERTGTPVTTPAEIVLPQKAQEELAGVPVGVFPEKLVSRNKS